MKTDLNPAIIQSILSDADRCGVPPHLADILQYYVTHGQPRGGCLRALLSNELMEFCHRADPETMAALPALARFMMSMPFDCFGAPYKVARWIKRNGLNGTT